MAFKNEKEFALGGSHIQDKVGAWFFFKETFPLRKFEFFNKDKLGYIGEACFSSVHLIKIAIFGKNLQKTYPKKKKKKKRKTPWTWVVIRNGTK